MHFTPEVCPCPYLEQGASVAFSPICGGFLLFMSLLEKFINGRCDIADPCKRVISAEDPRTEYDFVVVGGGTAGAIVASRLAENTHWKILLLEAGDDEPVASSVPSFYRNFWNNPAVDWMYRSQPQKDACLDQGDKGCVWPRGKVLGGTSVINGMAFHRGHRADYDEWVAAGATGWAWDDIMPYFLKSEGNKQIGTLVDGAFHSDSGPMPVQQYKYLPELASDILLGARDAGLPVVADLNDPTTPDGFAVMQAFNDNGSRYSTARAFLRPKSNSSNLDVVLRAYVTKVIFDGNQAVGVEYYREHNIRKVVAVSKEVIISAGALNSPHILLLSGVGPEDVLSSHNVPVVVPLPGVGRNLMNHVGINLFFLTNDDNTRTLDWAVSSEYLLNREGIMSSTGITQVTGFQYSKFADQSRGQPDLQFFFNGLYAECSETGAINELVHKCHAGLNQNISITGVALLPRSVGYLTLNSSCPFDPPLFYANYFEHPDDMEMLKEAGRVIRTIVESDILQNKWGFKHDLAYTSKCGFPDWSDEFLECMAREYTDPQNHQIGTAAIGGVVGPDLKVYSTKGLRVIDASVIPQLPTGNPQAVIMMIAEKGSDMIKMEWAES